MQPPSANTVTDVWFRSPLELRAIVETLRLSDVTFDAENYWEWAVGTLDGVELDVTRPHSSPAPAVDTRIFRLDKQPMSTDLRTKLVERLCPIARGSVSWGRWVYRKGNDFDMQEAGHVAAGE
jgi:hypothetical protein